MPDATKRYRKYDNILKISKILNAYYIPIYHVIYSIIYPILHQDEMDSVRAKFFSRFGRPYMMTCLRDMLYEESEDKNILLQPYRIMNSLMDRQDFGES